MTIPNRLIILPLLFLVSVLGMSQNILIDLQWEKEQLIVEGDTSFVSNCSYCLLKDNKPTIIYSITEVVDSVWIEKIESEYLLGYDIKGYNELELNIEKVVSGKKVITNLSIPAVFIENGRLKKIKSVSLRYAQPLVAKVNRLLRRKKTMTYASSSKLSSGTWYRLEINKDGVYKLDASYLKSLGINTNLLEGKKIKIYGSGNAMLPQINNISRHDDLVENAIVVTSVDDFSADDYVLFYGQSPHKVISDTASGLLSHEINLYTNSSYYFLTIDGEDGLRVGVQNDSGIATKTLNTSDEYVYLEEDLNNSLRSGRSWYGEHFDTYDKHSYALAVPDKVNDSPFRYQSAMMARAYSADVSFTTTFNGLAVGTQVVSKNAVNSHYYGVTGYDHVQDYYLNFSDYDNTNSLVIDVSFVGDASSSRLGGAQTHGYVNYFGVQYKRDLSTTAKQVVFRNFESLGQYITEFQLGISTSYCIWNITNSLEPRDVILTDLGDKQVFTEKSNSLNKYVLFANSGHLRPESFRLITNQDLHGINEVPEVVIITHDVVRAKAQEYADYRSGSGLTYLVVTPEEIYNEFSSGAQDISAIRDFLKMLYERNPNGLKCAVLFGGASFDYKGVVANNTNHVPTYQSIESLHNVRTYASDDYYGFLSDGDGEWAETNAGNHQMVISIGRILARNNEEAETLIKKIKHYETSPDAFGEWRASIALLADDGDGNLHVRDANNLSEIINKEYPSIQIDKLYLDDYEQTLSDDGWGRSPEFNEAYDRTIDKGAVLVNFTGHGASYMLAGERMIDIASANGMTNYEKLPLYVTATCEVGRYDDPLTTSSVIFSLLHNKKGGAIATITTTRPVYASTNYRINEAFYDNVFKRNTDSTYSSLGKVFMLTKNGSVSNVYNRNFSLLGDPCLKLSLPENKLILTGMNNKLISLEKDTLKSLAEVVFDGVVTDGLGNVISDFNGTLHVSVFDKEVDKKTLGSRDNPFSYKEWTNTLFDGLVTVEDGSFQIAFTVSKDISYEYELGKINMYAVNLDSTLEAIGNYANLTIGGTDPFSIGNDEAPLAELFMDDKSFIDGGFTGATTLFIAELFDDNGINLSSTGIGHEITLIIDGDIENTIILNSYYTTGLDEYRSGRVEYELLNLEEGNHHLKFTAWDTHNNPVIKELNFIVGTNMTFYTYPNPFEDEASLVIDHGGVGKSLVVDVTIIDDKGIAMLKESYSYIEAPSVIDNIVWDGTFNGTSASAGVYFVRVNLYYPNSETSISEIHKVVLLH